MLLEGNQKKGTEMCFLLFYDYSFKYCVDLQCIEANMESNMAAKTINTKSIIVLLFYSKVGEQSICFCFNLRCIEIVYDMYIHVCIDDFTNFIINMGLDIVIIL